MPTDTGGAGGGGGKRVGVVRVVGTGDRAGDGDLVRVDGDVDGNGLAEGDPRGGLVPGVLGGACGEMAAGWVAPVEPPATGRGDRLSTAITATLPTAINTIPMITPAARPTRRERGGGSGSRCWPAGGGVSGATAAASRPTVGTSSAGGGQRVGPGRGLPHVSQNRDVPAFVVPHGKHRHVSSRTTRPLTTVTGAPHGQGHQLPRRCLTPPTSHLSLSIKGYTGHRLRTPSTSALHGVVRQ